MNKRQAELDGLAMMYRGETLREGDETFSKETILQLADSMGLLEDLIPMVIGGALAQVLGSMVRNGTVSPAEAAISAQREEE